MLEPILTHDDQGNLQDVALNIIIKLSIICFSKANGANYYRPECKECNNNLSRKRKQLRRNNA